MCTHFSVMMRDDHRSVATGEISKAVARGPIKTSRNPRERFETKQAAGRSDRTSPVDGNLIRSR